MTEPSMFIVDPTDPHRAIHTPTSRMAGTVFVGKMPNPEAPTMRDIQAMSFVGFAEPYSLDV